MQRYEFSHYLCIVFRDKVLEYNKESALYSLKSPNYQEVYTRQRTAHTCGLPYCAYIQVFNTPPR